MLSQREPSVEQLTKSQLAAFLLTHIKSDAVASAAEICFSRCFVVAEVVILVAIAAAVALASVVQGSW